MTLLESQQLFMRLLPRLIEADVVDTKILAFTFRAFRRKLIFANFHDAFHVDYLTRYENIASESVDVS